MNYHVKFKEKLIERSWSDILVEYETINQWRIFDEINVFVKRDVIFNESKLIYKSSVVILDSVRDDSSDSFDSVRIDQENDQNVANATLRNNDQNLNQKTNQIDLASKTNVSQ